MTKKVVIIGLGFAGLNAAKVLGKAKNCQILVIDKTNHHLFQPLLYQVATAALAPSDIAMPIREIFKNHRNIETMMATVVAVSKEEKTVLLEDGTKIPYDYLIVAPGSRHSYFGKNHWEKVATGLKTLQDAIDIREKILAAFELAERTSDISERARLLTFVVVGGGPTGIEMAGDIAEIAHRTLKNQYRQINLNQTQIVLVEAASQLLGSYPINLANIAKKDLEALGVNVKLNTMVTEITDKGVYFEHAFLPAGVIIWAAGNEAAPLLKTLNVPVDKAGRVVVEPCLSIKNYPEIFVIGDACHLADKQGRSLPAVAPVAEQQGRHVGKIIKKGLAKEQRPAFRYWDRGMMAAIGKYKAIVFSDPIQCSGFIAWLAWCFVHIYFLIGYRTKLFVFIQWAFYFFKGQRNIRLLFKPLKHQLEKNN